MRNVNQVDFAAITSTTKFAHDAVVTDGRISVSFTIPYTRTCFDVAIDGTVIGRAHTVKTALALVNTARKAILTSCGK
jgi:hypothetical protein